MVTNYNDLQDGTVLKFVAHSKRVLSIALRYGWLPAARYTNLRDVRSFRRLGFLDIVWRNYDFERHLKIVMAIRPLMTVARDVETRAALPTILEQAWELKRHSENVVIVPKDPEIASDMDSIPREFLLGYSVPSRYGGTTISPFAFKGHRVHLLGGKPDVQRRLADQMQVVSIDCNRFTLDAMFGDYFDGHRFRRHPRGGYERCLRDSIRNINAIWASYPVEGG